MAAEDVAAEAEHAHAVGILVDHGVMVELVAVLGLDADLPSAHAPGLDRRHVAQGPGGLVEAVDQLLGGLIAREPIEVVPVLQLVLHFVPPGLRSRST